MKKAIILSLLSVAALSSGFAQIKKGEKLLGGNLTFSTQKNDGSGGTTTTSSTMFSPKLGFGIGSSWIVGVKGGIDLSNEKYEVAGASTTSKSLVYEAGLFARRFHAISDKVGIFAEAEAMYGSGKITDENFSGTKTETKINQMSVGVKPGLYFAATKSLLLEATVGNLGYVSGSSQTESSPKVKTSGFSATLANNISFGLSFIF